MECDLSKAIKVGFFGGTFDPIHLGHLNLAIQMLEIHELDQILFCPASQSPHKTETPPFGTKEERRTMAVMALAPLPKLTFLDMEIQRPTPTYTIDTIRGLIAMNVTEKKEKKHYHLILGEDSLEGFHNWKEVEELVVLAPPLIGSRLDSTLPKTLPKTVAAVVKKGMTKTSIMEISSTEVRRRLGLGLYCGHLLPAKVWEYINQNKLYIPK